MKKIEYAFQDWNRAMKDYGWVILGLLMVLPLLLFLVLLPEAGVDTTPTADDNDIDIIARSGVEGFPVDMFCADPLTKVTALPSPDASGVTYQLVRVRELVSETVVVVLDPEGKVKTDSEGNVLAKHYYDTTIGQDSEPAVVNDEARRCIERKARAS